MVRKGTSIKLSLATAVALGALNLGMSPVQAGGMIGGNRNWQQKQDGGERDAARDRRHVSEGEDRQRTEQRRDTEPQRAEEKRRRQDEDRQQADRPRQQQERQHREPQRVDQQRQFDHQRADEQRKRRDEDRQRVDRQRQFDQPRQFDRQHQVQDRRQAEEQRRREGADRQRREREHQVVDRRRAERPARDRDGWAQQWTHHENDRNAARVRARREQERHWGDLRERNWSHVRSWGSYGQRTYYRGADWGDWRRRHYVERPRYDWHHDHYSRPWFDYGSVTYIRIYAPTYVIPYNAYSSYGSSYYGPVACNRDVVGAVLGGVAGALIGAHHGGTGATVGGAIVGVILGGALGEAIDMSDQACYGQVLEYVPNDQPIYWEGNGAQYQVTPRRTYRGADGLYCREYQTSIYIDGYPQEAYGTACRQPDGSWQAVN